MTWAKVAGNKGSLPPVLLLKVLADLPLMFDEMSPELFLGLRRTLAIIIIK